MLIKYCAKFAIPVWPCTAHKSSPQDFTTFFLENLERLVHNMHTTSAG